MPAAVEEEDEEAAKKKKQEKKPREITPLIGRPEPSERDMMIELVFDKAVVMQSSSTILAVSCFNNKQVLICNVDIKTRSKSIRHKIDTKENPTYLFQIDDDYLLIGTQGGKFEIWNIGILTQETPTIKDAIDAHPGSSQGVSQIFKLRNPSPMVMLDKGDENCSFLVSSAADKPEILIWRMQVQGGNVVMKVHIQIKTSFTEGIKYIIQTSPTQLVAVNFDQTLMFYDFVDKAAQTEAEDKERLSAEFSSLVEEAFREADGDGNGWLDLDECKPMCEELIRSFGESLTEQ